MEWRPTRRGRTWAGDRTGWGSRLRAHPGRSRSRTRGRPPRARSVRGRRRARRRCRPRARALPPPSRAPTGTPRPTRPHRRRGFRTVGRPHLGRRVRGDRSWLARRAPRSTGARARAPRTRGGPTREMRTPARACLGAGRDPHPRPRAGDGVGPGPSPAGARQRERVEAASGRAREASVPAPRQAPARRGRRVRPRAWREDRALGPRDVFLDLDPADLACARRVLLRDVLGVPGLDDGGWGPVTGIELDARGPPVALGEAPERLVGGPLEREDVRREIAANDQARRSDLGEQALGAGGGGLGVVDEDVGGRRAP